MTDQAQQAPWRFTPPPALTGFLVLLVLLFAAAHAVGSAVGPVGPGLHPAEPGTDPGLIDGVPGGGVLPSAGTGTGTDDMDMNMGMRSWSQPGSYAGSVR